MTVTWNHIGLILVLIGTVIVGLSVDVRREHLGEAAHALDQARKAMRFPVIEPKETTINLWLLRGGLVVIALGTLLQW
jgi:hypothetical protein